MAAAVAVELTRELNQDVVFAGVLEIWFDAANDEVEYRAVGPHRAPASLFP